MNTTVKPIIISNFVSDTEIPAHRFFPTIGRDIGLKMTIVQSSTSMKVLVLLNCLVIGLY